MDSSLVINTTATSNGQGVNQAQGIYRNNGQTVNQRLTLTVGQQYTSPVGFSTFTISVVNGPVQLTAAKGGNATYINTMISQTTTIDDTVDSFIITNPTTNTLTAGLSLTFAVNTGTTPTPASIVTSVSGQVGDVVVKTVDNSGASGMSLIVDTGATTGTAKLRTIVPGANISLTTDTNGNLEISASGGGSGPGAVTSVNGQTGVVVINAVDNNDASGSSLIADSGAATGVIKLKNLAAGTGMSLLPDGNGNLVMASTVIGGVSSVSGQTGAVTVSVTDNNSATGTSLIADSGATSGHSKLLRLVPGSNVTLIPDASGNLVVSAASGYVLPQATTSTLGGVIVSTGLAIDGSGHLTNSGVLTVNGRSGGVILTSTDVGIPTDLLSGTNTTLATKYLPAAITGAVVYQSSWNASTNVPALASGVGTKGFYYVVSVAGTTNLDGIASWAVGDWAIFDGTEWSKIAASQTVTSVNNQAGAVVIQATNNNAATGQTLIVDSGATTGTMKFKTLVAGSNITVSPDSNGNLVVASTGSYVLPAATNSTLGGVIVGSGLSISAGVLSAPIYTLPAATASTLGGVKAGSGLSVAADGTLSVTASSGVTSFNTRTGAVVLLASDISGAGGVLAASGAFTARNTVVAEGYTVSNLGSVSGTVTINLANATEFVFTCTGATTLAFTGNPTGFNQVVYLRITNGGIGTFTIPSNVWFSGGTAYKPSASGLDLVGVKYDLTASVYMMFVIGQNIAA